MAHRICVTPQGQRFTASYAKRFVAFACRLAHAYSHSSPVGDVNIVFALWRLLTDLVVEAEIAQRRVMKTSSRRAIQHGSMYHMWPPQCQTQFGGRQMGDEKGLVCAGRGQTLPRGARQLVASVISCFDSMDEADCLSGTQGRFDLGKAAHHLPRSCRKSEAAEKLALQKCGDLIAEIVSDLCLSLQSTVENMLPAGFLDDGSPPFEPHAAPGEACFEIGDDVAFGRCDEAYQPVLRQHLPGDGTHSPPPYFGAGVLFCKSWSRLDHADAVSSSSASSLSSSG
nr:hypothetical protein [Afifella aestuarii]